LPSNLSRREAGAFLSGLCGCNQALPFELFY